ncbi:MAG: hypothetical protein ACRDOL_13715, partial [Streptosporangiaceae bacterium]
MTCEAAGVTAGELVAAAAEAELNRFGHDPVVFLGVRALGVWTGTCGRCGGQVVIQPRADGAITVSYPEAVLREDAPSKRFRWCPGRRQARAAAAWPGWLRAGPAWRPEPVPAGCVRAVSGEARRAAAGVLVLRDR